MQGATFMVQLKLFVYSCYFCGCSENGAATVFEGFMYWQCRYCGDKPGRSLVDRLSLNENELAKISLDILSGIK